MSSRCRPHDLLDPGCLGSAAELGGRGWLQGKLTVLHSFAIENGPFIVDLPVKDGDFP